MSDSDSDFLQVPKNGPSFQSLGTSLYVKGVGINSTNVSSLSLRNNIMTSTMNRPWNLDRPRYAESVCDPRSMSYRRERETSPMSFRSATGLHQRNFQNSYYGGGLSFQRSMYNGRSGSPMSVRTIDSNISMSAKDIVCALESNNFNQSELKSIQNACNKLVKHRSRRRVEKRRNIRKFLKGFRRRSGGDSGDQASESSASSDDCRSIRTSRSTMYKGNASSCRSTRTDISHFIRKMRESNMIRDCSDSLRHKSFKSKVSGRASNTQDNLQNLLQERRNITSFSLEDRFKKGFSLPSKRFDPSIASLSIQGNPNRLQRISECNMFDVGNMAPNHITRTENPGTQDSEQEEIFAVTAAEKSSFNNNCKRSHDDDPPMPNKKKTKLSPQTVPPKSRTPKSKTPEQNQQSSLSKRKSEFVFAKPQLPIKKQTIVKQKSVLKSSQPQQKNRELNTESNAAKPDKTTKTTEQPKEKVISSSIRAVEQLALNSKLLEPKKSNIKKTTTQRAPDNIAQEKESCLESNTTQQSTTDMSLRPSFIKRKLFTQKYDVTEKNSSSDSLQTDSPQTSVYSKIQKEKNRARKLVTTQSCLSRDVADDSNLLELIHKIVPADQMNITTAANRTDMQNNKNNPADANKWDLASIIPTCNNTDVVSDTYTDDEEIFIQNNDKREQNKSNKQKEDDKQKYKVKDQTKDKPTDKETQPVKEAKKKNAVNVNKNIDIKQINTNNEVHKQTHNMQTSMASNCKVIIEKTPIREFLAPPAVNVPPRRISIVKACEYKSVKSFWDTDTESDLEHTPLRRINLKPTDTSKLEVAAKASVKNISMGNELANGNQKNIANGKTNEIGNYKSNSQNISMNTIAINKPVQVESRNKTVQKEATVKSKPIDKNQSIQKVKEKLTVSRKENNPPDNISKETSKTKTKSLNSQCAPKPLQKSKAQNKVNNNDSTFDNNESQHNNASIYDKSMRIRAQRKPKVNKCCGEEDTSLHSVVNNNTLCKTLRSRQVDLSTSSKSDYGNATKNTTANNKVPAKKQGNKNIRKKTDQNDSDISFTLTEILPSNRTLRLGSTAHSKSTKNGQSDDVSFTLRSKNKTLNDTRSSRQNRELKSLLNNSGLLLNLGKTSQLNKKVAAESIALNRTSNRSRRLL